MSIKKSAKIVSAEFDILTLWKHRIWPEMGKHMINYALDGSPEQKAHVYSSRNLIKSMSGAKFERKNNVYIYTWATCSDQKCKPSDIGNKFDLFPTN